MYIFQYILNIHSNIDFILIYTLHLVCYIYVYTEQHKIKLYFIINMFKYDYNFESGMIAKNECKTKFVLCLAQI